MQRRLPPNACTVKSRHAGQKSKPIWRLGATSTMPRNEPSDRPCGRRSIPTVNGLMVVGIVTLPGMMTGQILAGASPLIAIRYQIVVVFMQAAAVAMTTAVVTLWYRRTYLHSRAATQGRDTGARWHGELRGSHRTRNTLRRIACTASPLRWCRRNGPSGRQHAVLRAWWWRMCCQGQVRPTAHVFGDTRATGIVAYRKPGHFCA